MLLNISYYPDERSFKEPGPALAISDFLPSLRSRFPCVEPVANYAIRFSRGNTQGVLFDSGYAELVAPEQDAAVFCECARLLIDIFYRGEIKLFCFDAVVDNSPANAASIGLYQKIAQDSQMHWTLSETEGLRPVFSAHPEQEETHG